MNRKTISFGKINFKAPKSCDNTEITSGFGTFGQISNQHDDDVEKISEDLESQHVEKVMGIKNFGKKAHNFNIEEMMEKAKEAARENAKKNLEQMKNKDLSKETVGPEISNNSTNENSDDEDLIGPPIPTQLEENTEKNKKPDIKGNIFI